MSNNKSLVTKHSDEKVEPVYFLEISVENVRCFVEKQVLDLSNGKNKPAQWTIILGDNGTGKTTLLKCIAALEPSERKWEDLEAPFLKDTYGRFPKGIIYGFQYERKRDEVYLIAAETFFKGFLNGDQSEILKGYGFGRLNRESIDAYFSFKTIKTEDIKNLKIFAYGASRRMGKGSLTDTQNPDATASLFSEDVSLINAEEWLLQAIFAMQNSAGETKAYAQNRYEKIKQMLLTLLPDVEDIRVKPITKEQLKAAIEVQTPYGWVGMTDLSLGYQASIAWMVDLASRLLERYPDSANPLEEPAIVLIDEIDLHLHPKWQRTLISSLTEIFKQTQFIVTAHSPLIVQSVQEANIVLLKREGNQVKIYNNKEEDIIKGWRYDQVLTSDLFDLPSARPPEYDKFLKRREELLAKARLTKKDKEELESIGKKLDELPIVSQTPQEREAMEILHKAADIFKARVKP